MPSCLIVTPKAPEFAAEIERLAGGSIPTKACTTADEALAAYTDETIVFGNPDLIATILPQMPTVDWVQSTWAGVRPLMHCPRRDYILTGVKDVFGPQMSEYVLGYLLAHELRILERAQAQRKRQWLKTHSGILAGKRLGILGTGSIGRHIARSARSLGLEVIGLSRSGAPVDEFKKVFLVRRLYSFLQMTDYLVSTLPQTPETDLLLDAAALAKLPAGAYFINVGRSNVIDDDALTAALRNGHLAGAALDVFAEEPVPANSPLWETPNLRITAHIAAVSHPALIVPIFLDNYRRYSVNQALSYVIDFAAGY